MTSPERSGHRGKKASPRTEVLHVITGTSRRGAETFALDLAVALDERGRSGRTVALAAGPHPELDVPTLGRKTLGFGTLVALRKEARRAGVVIAHGSSAVVACALATLGTRTPFVYRNIGDPSFWLSTPRRKLQMRWILRRARVTVALWPESASELRALGGDATIKIVPNGVLPTLFPPANAEERRDARRRLGLDPRGIVVAFVGSLSGEKNVDVAIKAVASIPAAEMIVIGDGADRAGLEAAAAESAPGRIRFLGSSERPREELAAADVVVLPSKTEGIPAVLIEAAFMELPVVASAVGGVPEIVEDGRTGFLVPPGDWKALAAAIPAAVADATTMGRAARARCLERFDIGVVADAWEDLLTDIGTWSEKR